MLRRMHDVTSVLREEVDPGPRNTQTMELTELTQFPRHHVGFVQALHGVHRGSRLLHGRDVHRRCLPMPGQRLGMGDSSLGSIAVHLPRERHGVAGLGHF